LLDAAEAEMRAAEDRCESLTVAVEAINAQITAIEQDQAQKRDRAVRESTARDLNLRADKFEKLIPLWVDVLRDSAAVGELAKPVVGEEIGLYTFFKQIETQIPDAYRDIALQLRLRAEEVLTGRAPAALPKPTEVIPPAPPVPRQRVFLLQNVKWNEGGVQQLAERFDFRDLPIEAVRMAIQIGVATPPDSPRAQETKHLRKGAPPDPARCYDLDTGEAPKPAGSAPWDAFARIDRGPPTRMSLAPPLSFEPAAARQAPLQKNEPDHE
jgi:hypothetical protein